MINKKIRLFESSDAVLTTYVLDDGEFIRSGIKRPAVVICPGGGYTYVSKNEGEPVALAYARRGYHAFVLDYSVKIQNPFPTALRELAKAMSIVRDNADKWLVDKNDISVIGFSAGGNLALSLGIYYNNNILTRDLELAGEQIKPNQLILGYPAVTMHSKHGSQETPKEIIEMMEKGLIPDFRGPNIKEILLGKENPTKEEEESLNLLRYVNKSLPKTFIWGTYEDSVIPATDLLGLAAKMYELNIPCELHMFQKGPHGTSICDETMMNKKDIEGLSIPYWVELSLKWLEQNRNKG